METRLLSNKYVRSVDSLVAWTQKVLITIHIVEAGAGPQCFPSCLTSANIVMRFHVVKIYGMRECQFKKWMFNILSQHKIDMRICISSNYINVQTYEICTWGTVKTPLVVDSFLSLLQCKTVCNGRLAAPPGRPVVVPRIDQTNQTPGGASKIEMIRYTKESLMCACFDCSECYECYNF